MFGWMRKHSQRNHEMHKECGHGRNHNQNRRRHRNHRNHLEEFQTRKLSEVNEGEKCIIIENHDKKTIEMGLYSGNKLQIMKNESTDNNIIISVGESRFIIPKDTASEIIVK